METRRKYERTLIALGVTFVNGEDRVVARSRDVSLGGMFVETDRPLPYGTIFELSVALPSLPVPALIEATVRWVGPTGMGIQWGTLRAQESWAINQVVT